jgi:hypothetical protein
MYYMKKLILTTCILVFTLLAIKVSGQDLVIQVSSEAVSTAAATDGKIEVIIDSGEPEYVFFLYDNEPWQEANQIRKSAPTFDGRYVFEDLPAGRYFAGVIDNSGKSTFKEIYVKITDK